MVTTGGTELRSARPEDLAALRTAAAGALHHDGDAADVVDLLWNGPATRPELRLAAEVAGRPVGVALGSLSEADGLVRGHVNLLAVAPGHQGRGHGRQLLSTLEARLRDCGARQLVVRGSTPAYAWPGVDFRYTAAVCLLEAHGYERTNEAVNMAVELDTAPLETAGDERRLAALGLTVRRLRPEDEPRFSAWMRGWGGTWQQEAALALTCDPVGCHVAVRGEGDQAEYVGFACHGVNRRTWFGPMGTEESLRGQGVGAVLLRRCLADQRAAGLSRAEIGWTGPLRFYARAVGASLDRVFWLYRKDC
ncbi:GNAT family N-acetyltransferase [Streptacidiphilus griseoplanus]|uniref:GNAT family N-acetyltransferase n=1 Tax=Peterkaempfera griseoplana TaxID=66896 RepID=UPI0006E32C8B|nr:GNAT family N-acetyltransferase [Peterkaempfera griseoplana]